MLIVSVRENTYTYRTFCLHLFFFVKQNYVHPSCAFQFVDGVIPLPCLLNPVTVVNFITEDNITDCFLSGHLAMRTDGVRKEYGEYHQHLNYFAYGQAGFSVKVTQDNSIIIGAPGLLQWTGN